MNLQGNACCKRMPKLWRDMSFGGYRFRIKSIAKDAMTKNMMLRSALVSLCMSCLRIPRGIRPRRSSGHEGIDYTCTYSTIRRMLCYKSDMQCMDVNHVLSPIMSNILISAWAGAVGCVLFRVDLWCASASDYDAVADHGLKRLWVSGQTSQITGSVLYKRMGSDVGSLRMTTKDNP